MTEMAAVAPVRMTPDREDEVFAAVEPFLPVIIHAAQKRRRGHHGVMTELLVHGARVGRFAVAHHVLVADVAADARDDADADLVVARERRTLLDMQFDEAGDLLQIDDRRAGGELAGIKAAAEMHWPSVMSSVRWRSIRSDCVRRPIMPSEPT